jgi:hypothetical protein
MLQTQRFGAYLLVRKEGSNFQFNPVSSMNEVGVDIGSDEWLQNYTTKIDQAMNGTKPWRGPREKSKGFWQVLIEACSKPGDIVLDCHAMTGELKPPYSTLLFLLFYRRHSIYPVLLLFFTSKFFGVFQALPFMLAGM